MDTPPLHRSMLLVQCECQWPLTVQDWIIHFICTQRSPGLNPERSTVYLILWLLIWTYSRTPHIRLHGITDLVKHGLFPPWKRCAMQLSALGSHSQLTMRSLFADSGCDRKRQHVVWHDCLLLLSWHVVRYAVVGMFWFWSRQTKWQHLIWLLFKAFLAHYSLLIVACRDRRF